MPFLIKRKSKKALIVWKRYVNDNSREWRYETDYFLVWREIHWDQKAYWINQLRKKLKFTLNVITQFINARKKRKNWEGEWFLLIWKKENVREIERLELESWLGSQCT